MMEFLLHLLEFACLATILTSNYKILVEIDESLQDIKNKLDGKEK